MVAISNLNETVNSLVKVANTMIDSIEGQESQKLSPEEALAGVEEAISLLEQIAEGIPAESAPQEQEPAATPEQAVTPPGEKPDPRIAKLQQQVATLTAQAQAKDRNIILEKIASFYTEGDKKFEAIKQAKESIPVLTARLETLTELAGSGVSRTAQTSTITMQRFAKLNVSDDRRHSL